jgi:2-methylisocitrate lyase-like PEP mutase family enzyme
MRGNSFSLPELAAAGVRRVSLSTSLYRAAMAGLAGAGLEVKERGTFGYVESIMKSDELEKYLRALTPPPGRA